MSFAFLRKWKVYRRLYIFERCDGHCVWCGFAFDDAHDTRITVDHIIPCSHGGSRWWENLLLSCKPCNNHRGNRLVHDYVNYCKQNGLAVNAELILRAYENAYDNPLCLKQGYASWIHEQASVPHIPQTILD